MNGVQAAAVGRPGRDGEMKYLPSGQALLIFPLAVDDQKKREGDETQWLRVTVWGERAEALAERVKKGSGLWYVEGRAKVRTWTNQAGETRADLELSAWRCEPLFQHGRPRQDDQQPRRMPESVAIRGVRSSAVLDREDDLEDLPF